MFNLATGQYLFKAKEADEMIRANKECDLTYARNHMKFLS